MDQGWQDQENQENQDLSQQNEAMEPEIPEAEEEPIDSIEEEMPEEPERDDKQDLEEGDVSADASDESEHPREDESDSKVVETNESGEPEVREEASAGVTREQIVEALLFSSEGPLSASKIANVIGAVSSQEIREVIDRLNQHYCELNRSFQVQEIAGGFQMVTRPEYANYLQQLFKIKSENKLSGAALETLAVIAYKQPVLRAEVEAVRGVSCGEMIRAVMEKDLIKIVGRAEELGRPMLYGTTKHFLEVFGLGSLEDLPKVPELLPTVKHTPINENETKPVEAQAEPSAEKPDKQDAEPVAASPEKADSVPDAPEEPVAEERSQTVPETAESETTEPENVVEEKTPDQPESDESV